MRVFRLVLVLVFGFFLTSIALAQLPHLFERNPVFTGS
jgi:hypothetical protein